MSAQLAPFQDDDNVVEMNDGPGRRLRLTRQARSLGLERVAAELHLPPERVAALERDDYEALPGRVFVMGYMRNYARLLGLDPEPLLEAFRAAEPEATAVRQHAITVRHTPGGYLPLALISLAILIALGGLAFAWWQASSTPPPAGETAPTEAGEGAGPVAAPSPPSPNDPPPEAGQEPGLPGTGLATAPLPVSVPDLEAGLPPDADRAAVAEPGVETEAVEEDLSAGSTDTGEATPETGGGAAAGETEATAEPAQPEIAISFSGPCWVDIRDSEDDFKLFGEMNKGDHHLLGGTPPYSLILGNTAAASISIDGEPFDLSPFARGNVARFTLDPAERP